MLSLAGAEDMTQRRPNPYFLRPSATSSQAMHVMGHYAAKEMGLKKRAITIDFGISPSAYEQEGGFQAAFEKDGGCVVNKLWTPLGTPDYTPYIAQITDCDGVCQGFAGVGPAALHEAVCRFRSQIPGGHRRNRRRRRAAARLRRRSGRHDELHAPTRSTSNTDGNKKFVKAMLKDFNVVPGFYAAGLYVNCHVVEAGLKGARRQDRRQGESSWPRSRP